ncbi:RNA methyltransferase [Gregarina niphandrodes]|uniref:16S rRNA (uracil(1498)-N(3))-methyltransferase n=1 Tax=Gregarina niphandrodes TaxID=110365 RepID=A0A023AZE4_GRENI|nr:RNA methyltransferase [Gregarina niphandrodes]EZG44125.1 RNA methyltransferase [Gregarina niphandrodes]|eukprot:XP_011132794.1 RNA methyltransferase [Gregarina niphandrodes]
MNILAVLVEEIDDEGGSFCPDATVQKHLLETLRSQEGDIVKVGVVRGQKGVGQLHISGDKYRVQLLPLDQFSAPEDVFRWLGEEGKLTEDAERAGNTEGRAADEEVETLPRCTLAKRLKLTVRPRPDRYMFGALTGAQFDAWKTHPWELPGATEMNGVRREAVPLVDLFVALPRPRLFDKLLQYMGSMSIGQVGMFVGTRSDLAYFSSPKMGAECIAKSLRLGLEQGMRTTPPPVTVSASLSEGLKQLSAFYDEAAFRATVSLVAHPYAVHDRTPLHLMDPAVGLTLHQGPVLLVLGPEGGFTNEEVQLLLTCLPNPHLITLGKDILRCEVAILSLIAQTNLLLTAPRSQPPYLRLPTPQLLQAPIKLPVQGRRSCQREQKPLPEQKTILERKTIPEQKTCPPEPRH